MIRLRNILLEQSGKIDKMNVLFVTDYPVETIGNFAKRLIATGKVTGEIKSYKKASSKEAASLVDNNISDKVDLVVVQVSGVRDETPKSFLYNLRQINNIASRKKIPVIFIATPSTEFASDSRDFSYIDQVYNVLSKHVTVIDLPEINDDSYFAANGLILSQSGNQIVYRKVLDYLKSIDSSIKVTPEDNEVIDTEEKPQRKSATKNANVGAALSTAPIKHPTTDWENVMAFLIEKGLTIQGAAGVAGNMKIESNFNPSAIGDHGTSYGLCQWHASRKTALENFAKENNNNPADAQVQLEFLWKELTTSYSGLVNYLSTTEDPRDAAYQFASQFERPAHISESRMDYAEQYATDYDPSIMSQVVSAAGDMVSGAWNSLTGIAATVGIGSMLSGDKKIDKRNGNLSSAELKPIGNGLKLAPAAADSYLRMKADYENEFRDPITKKVTKTFKPTDGYRSYHIQNIKFDWDLYKRTGKKKKIGTNGSVNIAYPGTSNHGWGKAIDLFPKHAQDWVRANGMKYGWTWAEGKAAGESWHFTYIK